MRPVSFVDVYKSFGSNAVLRGFDLQLESGELVALVGANGAGKTTALSMLVGLRRPDKGTVRLFGTDPREPNHRSLLGAAPQELSFPPLLRVSEILRLVGGHYVDPMPVDELVEAFGLGSILARQSGGLSGGQRRRLALALTFIGRPRLAVLDEPTAALDVDGRQRLWQFLRSYISAGNAALLTSHYLEEVEALASRVALLADGRVQRIGTVEEMRAMVSAQKIVRFRADIARDRLAHFAFDEGWFSLRTEHAERELRRIFSENLPISELSVVPISFEDAVSQLLAEVR